MQFSLSTGSSFVSAALAETEVARSPASTTRQDDTDMKNRDIFHLMMEKPREERSSRMEMNQP
jgi:hypothetical protein